MYPRSKFGSTTLDHSRAEPRTLVRMSNAAVHLCRGKKSTESHLGYRIPMEFGGYKELRGLTNSLGKYSNIIIYIYMLYIHTYLYNFIYTYIYIYAPSHDVKPGLHVEELPDQDRVPLLPSLLFQLPVDFCWHFYSQSPEIKWFEAGAGRYVQNHGPSWSWLLSQCPGKHIFIFLSLAVLQG